jgi:hypothetical protein
VSEGLGDSALAQRFSFSPAQNKILLSRGDTY